MLTSAPQVTAVALPSPTTTGTNSLEWRPEGVVVIGARVFCDRGDWTADEANTVGLAMMAGALSAGASSADAGCDVVALPAPLTPAWGEPGFIYFLADDTYTFVDLGDGRSGRVWVGDELVSAEVAWSEGLALVAAARLASHCGGRGMTTRTRRASLTPGHDRETIQTGPLSNPDGSTAAMT